MRSAEEWNEDDATQADVLTHFHSAPTYTWGDGEDGVTWQIGACETCKQDVGRKLKDGIYTEWTLVP